MKAAPGPRRLRFSRRPAVAAGQAPPPLVSTAPPVPEAQMARSPEALKLFGRLDDDRAVVFIASGPADARVTVRCPGLFRAVEIWTYLEHPTLGKNARILFYPGDADRVVPVLDGPGRRGGALSAVRQDAVARGRREERGLLRGRPDARFGREGRRAPPGRQQRRARRARRARGAALRPAARGEGRGARAAPRLEQAADREGAQEAHRGRARKGPPLPRRRRADHHGRRARHAPQADRGLPARPVRRRLLEAAFDGPGRDADAVQGHLRDAPRRGQAPLREHQHGHGPDLPAARPAGRHPQDRLPGRLLADPDLVLRAHRGAPDVQGAPPFLPAARRRATTASGLRWTGRARSSSETSRAR